MKKMDKRKGIKQATNKLNTLIKDHMFLALSIAIVIIIVVICGLKSVIENYPSSAMVFVTSTLVIITAIYVYFTDALAKTNKEQLDGYRKEKAEKKEKERKTFLNILRYEIEGNYRIAEKWETILTAAANNKSTKDVTLPLFYHASWSAFMISDGINYLDEKQIHKLFEIYETFSTIISDFEQIKALEVEGRSNYDSIQAKLEGLRGRDQKNVNALRDMKNTLKNINL